MKITIRSALFSHDIPEKYMYCRCDNEVHVYCTWQIRTCDHHVVKCKAYILDNIHVNENGFRLVCILQLDKVKKTCLEK